VFVAVTAMLVALVPAAASAATNSATINFEGLAEGAIVTSVSSGSGISGDAIAGSVGVSASGGSGDAMIFDSDCGGGCSGEDPDLQSNTGKVLIVSEDGNSADPDDNHIGGTLSFTFPFEVTVMSFQITDYGDRSGAAGSYQVGGNAAVALPTAGNGVTQTVNVGQSGTTLVVTTNDSYSIDNIVIEWDVPDDDPGTGTPGYWKNHPEAWPVDTITVGGVIYTKDQAIANMNTPGGGDKTYNMFSQLVAAMLNVAIGNDDSCIASTITAANAWLATNPLGSNVRANSAAWQSEGSVLHSTLDAYNNGLLCAPPRD
jgi:hypothetical protein